MIVKKAFAKINLTLEIGEKRENGYHSLTSVMARATLADTVKLQKNDSGFITFSSTDKEIPPDDNLCIRAARAYFEAKGISGQGVDILLENSIPVASGMGGGSADSAAVILAMEELFGALDKAVRHAMARSLGADVPYCLNEKPCLCTGIGDECSPISSAGLDGLYLVISKVGEKQSTGRVYSDFDALEKSDMHYSHCDLIRAMEEGNIKRLSECVFNDFERVVLPSCPSVACEKERLLAAGALSVVMSGAGPALAALFDSKEKAEKCGTIYKIIT